MTDDNPLPNPRRSPDSDPPLPAWMTLPGSLVQPGAPAVEETDADLGAEEPDTAPADPAAASTETAPGLGAWDGASGALSEEVEEGSPPAGSGPVEPDPADDAESEPVAGVVEHAEPESGAAERVEPDVVESDATVAEVTEGSRFASAGAVEPVSAEEPTGDAEPEPVPDAPEAGAVEQGEPEPAVAESGEVEQGVAGEPDGGSGGGPTLAAALEAILLVVDEPVAEVTLAQVLERPTHEVGAALRGLAAEYTASGRGFDLREVAGGWRFYTRADCAQLVERFVRDGQQSRLTQAALETLAVVAYRQPVSRARVAAVRGVNSDGVMRTLVARGLVEEAGSDPESQAVLYRTSSYFLERLGLRDLSELPELAPFLPDDLENLEETTK